MFYAQFKIPHIEPVNSGMVEETGAHREKHRSLASELNNFLTFGLVPSGIRTQSVRGAVICKRALIPLGHRGPRMENA